MKKQYLFVMLSYYFFNLMSSSTFVRFNSEISPFVINAINNARRVILVAMYTLTDKEISAALLKAQERGVDVHVVADRFTTQIPSGQALKLYQKGIQVHEYFPQEGEKMHNKYFIFYETKIFEDTSYEPWVISGSCNATNAAFTKNEENMVFIPGLSTFLDFYKNFERLRADSHPIHSRILRAALAKKQKEEAEQKKDTSESSISAQATSNSPEVANLPKPRKKPRTLKIKPTLLSQNSVILFEKPADALMKIDPSNEFDSLLCL